MPYAECSFPRCSQLLRPPHVRCEKHRGRERAAAQKRRYEHAESTTERGYGADWRRLRNAHLKAHPTCQCGAPATEVHHIVPFSGRGDPIRLAEQNLLAVCAPCHRRLTRSRRRGRAPARAQG